MSRDNLSNISRLLDGFQGLNLFTSPFYPNESFGVLSSNISVHLSDEVLEEYENKLASGKNLSPTEKLTLEKVLEINFNTLFDFIFKEKGVNLWKLLATPSNRQFWDNLGLYVYQKNIHLNQLLDFDKDVVLNSFVNSSCRPENMENVESTTVVLKMLESLNFNEINDDKLISCLKPLIKNHRFNDTITKVIINMSKSLNFGRLDLGREEKSISLIQQSKLLYIFVSEIDLDANFELEKHSHNKKILETIEVLLNNFYSILFTKKRIIEGEMDLLEKQINMSNSKYFSNGCYSIIEKLNYSLIARFKKYLNQIINILNNEVLNNKLEYFFTKSIVKKIFTDNILGVIGVFFENNRKRFNNDVAEFVVSTINSKVNTSNPHVRSTYLAIATTHEEKCDIFDEKLTEASINFFNDIELNKDDSLLYEKRYIRDDVYNYFMKNFNIQLIEKIDKTKIKMFINFIVRDISTFFDIFKKYIENYISIEDEYILQQKTNTVNIVVEYIDKAITILKKFIDSKSIDPYLLSSEILIVFRTVIFKGIQIYNNIFVEQQNKIEEISQLIYTKIEFYRPIIKLVKIVNELDKKSLEMVFNDTGIDRVLFGNISLILSTIDSTVEIIDLADIGKDEDIEYPEEYLDQITFEVLVDPVIIPGTEIVTNRGSISQYIMTDGMNPYTKQPLSLEDLQNFNDQKEVKDKMDKLKKDIEDFKNISGKKTHK